MTFTYETRTNRDGSTTYSKTINLGHDPKTGKRKQTRVSAQTVRELKRRYTETLNRVQSGTFAEPSKVTTREYLTHWLGTIEAAVRSSSHRRFSEVIHGRVIPKLGNVPLTKLSPLHVQELYSECLASGLSSSTVALYHNVLHRSLEQAVKWQLILRNPCDAVDAPREVNPEMKTWTGEQTRAFLAAAVNDDLAALWILAVHTGMRRGEILAVRWQDVDLERATLAVRRTMTRDKNGITFGEPKSKSGRRSLALPVPVVTALKAHKAQQNVRRLALGDAWQPHDLVFDRGDGTLLHPNTMAHAFARLVASVQLTDGSKLPRIRFHDLRHTAATLMLANGEHPKIVQERLGHSDISMTLNRYSHVTMDIQRDAADRLARLLSS